MVKSPSRRRANRARWVQVESSQSRRPECLRAVLAAKFLPQGAVQLQCPEREHPNWGGARGGMRPPVGGVSPGGHMGGAQTVGGRTGPLAEIRPWQAHTDWRSSQSGGVALGGVAGGTSMNGGTPMIVRRPRHAHTRRTASGRGALLSDVVMASYDGEECDDGNQVDTDQCTTECRPARCRDGLVQAVLGEECDDGNLSDTDACISNCSQQPAETAMYARVEEWIHQPISMYIHVGRCVIRGRMKVFRSDSDLRPLDQTKERSALMHS